MTNLMTMPFPFTEIISLFHSPKFFSLFCSLFLPDLVSHLSPAIPASTVLQSFHYKHV